MKKRDSGNKVPWREQVRQAMLEMDAPAYALLDVPRIELTGGGQLLEYSEECIRVAARGMAIRVTGMDLQLRTMTKTEITVTGLIASVELQR